MKKNCVICNTEFQPKTSEKTCSNISCKKEQKKKLRIIRLQDPIKYKAMLARKKRYKDKTKHLRNKYDDANKQNRQCVICQKEYIGNWKSTTCSKECRQAHARNRKRALRPPKEISNCLLCGVDIVLTRSDKKYCKKCAESRKKFNLRIRVGIIGVMKGRFKSSVVWDYLDFNLGELQERLESLFIHGMSWDNYGKWHIDHIRPVSSFNYTTTECDDFKKCWALENLQPLWAEDNIKKGNKWDGKING